MVNIEIRAFLNISLNPELTNKMAQLHIRILLARLRHEGDDAVHVRREQLVEATGSEIKELRCCTPFLR